MKKEKEDKKGLKKLDPNASSFIANGTTYYIESVLSVGRFIEFQQIEQEASFGMDLTSIWKELDQIDKDMNTIKFTDAAVRIRNLKNGIVNIQKKTPSIFKLCALFINMENEDRATITDDLISRKIEDWSEYESEPFFGLALASINGFADIYKTTLAASTKGM